MVSLDQDFSFITEGLKANVKFAFDTQAWHGNKYTQQDEIWHAVPVSYTHLDVYKRQTCTGRLEGQLYG